MPKQPALAIVIADKAGKRAKEKYPGNPGNDDEKARDEEMELAGADVMAAMEAKDTKAFSQSLKSFVEMCY